MNNPSTNKSVQFLIRDIVHPRPFQVFFELFHQKCISGHVVAVTDGGAGPTRFLVVRVEGLSEPVIVAAERVLRALPERAAGQTDAPEPLVAWEDKSRAPV